jgi:hypothetical protein
VCKFLKEEYWSSTLFLLHRVLVHFGKRKNSPIVVHKIPRCFHTPPISSKKRFLEVGTVTGGDAQSFN